MDGPGALLFRHPPEYRITGVAGRGAYAVVCRADVVDRAFSEQLDFYQASPSSRQVSAQYNSDMVSDAPQFNAGESPIQAAQRQASSALIEDANGGEMGCPAIAGDLAPGHFSVVRDGAEDTRPAYRVVAIKRLLDHCSRRRAVPPEFALHYLRKVCREIAILKHFRAVPQVIPILDLYMGPDAEDVYIVMPYIQYNLKQVILNHELPEPLIKWIIMQLLLGLRALHGCGIIHRDLTLNNVLVDGDTWDAWISDFGLSRAREAADVNLTLEVVTLPYRAPELLMEYDNYTTAVDIWALGCVMAECFLRSPFMHLGENQNPDALKQLRHIMKTLTGYPDLSKVSEFASERNGMFLKQSYATLQAKGGTIPAPTDVGDRLRNMLPTLEISEDAVNVLRRMLVLVPGERATVEELLQMPWFTTDGDCVAVLEQAYETQPPDAFTADLEIMTFEQLQAGLIEVCQGRTATVESVLRPTTGWQLDLGNTE